MRTQEAAGLRWPCVFAAACMVLSFAGPAFGASPSALLWTDPGRPVPESIQSVLEEAGYEVQTKDSGAIAEVLSASPCPDLLGLPYGGSYPAEAASAIAAFMNGGGGLVIIGGTPFTEALLEVSGRTVFAQAGLSGGTAIPLDRPWTGGQAYTGVDFSMTPAKDSTFARFSAENFMAYGYAGTQVPAIQFSDGVLVFSARNIEDTPRLCVELTARDNSRWKHVVELGTGWREYRIHLADFAAYNTTTRGAGKNFLRAEELRKIMFGFTAAMVGAGRHVFDIRNLLVEPAAVPGDVMRAVPRFKQPDCSAARWFGTYVQEEAYLPTPFRAGPVITGRLICDGANEGKTWSSHVFHAPETQSSSQELPAQLKHATRVLSEELLSIRGEEGAAHCVVGFSAFLTGPGAGGRQLVHGLPGASLSESAAARKAFLRGLHRMRKAVLVAEITPEFALEEKTLHVSASVSLLEPPGMVEPMHITGSYILGGTHHNLGSITSASGEGGSAFPASCAIPWTLASARQSYQIAITAEQDSPGLLLGDSQFRVEPRKAFRAICSFMKDCLDSDGQLYGNRFLDCRGVRALLAAADMFENEGFRETALHWVEEKVLDDQREDGGYRMGYGIGKKGEECYVADGGEIAIGVAQAACHTTGARREAFLESLDRYMDYRESFRVDSGGIGVGWCLRDYSKRPTVPLDKPTRIFAPEKNTYTIGCTLAAAYAHARIRGGAELERRAEGDADWLMARAKTLNGAYIESYIYAHALTRDPERKRIYEDFIRRAFRDKMAAQWDAEWWLTGGGRTALNLDGLAYWCQGHPDDGEAGRALHRALAFMFSPDSPQSITQLISSGKALSHDEWIYICYGTLSLADILSPIISMERLLGENGVRS